VVTRGIKIFADGADIEGIRRLAEDPHISGFTTNPTLMHQVGITDYASFAQQVLEVVTDRPISFEVFSDDFEEMARQARLISSWGENANVKIPITNTRGDSSVPLIKELADEGIRLNITAIMSPTQVEAIAGPLSSCPGSIISVFAGRVADTGRDPIPLMRECLEILRSVPTAELLWASPREILNVYQAAEIGCHIITVQHDVLAKLSLEGKDLHVYSLETVQMFRNDAVKAGFTL
jgi:transaldolase